MDDQRNRSTEKNNVKGSAGTEPLFFKEHKMDQHSANTIETIKGKNNILVIAPHGIHDDDKNTGILASLMAEHLGCYAVINEKYKKPRNGKRDFVDLGQDIADLNRLNVIKKENVLMEKWLNPIVEFKNEIVNYYGSCLVILLHGIQNESIKAINPNADILLGTGLPDRHSIKKEIVDEITKSLKDKHSVNAIETDASSTAVTVKLARKSVINAKISRTICLKSYLHLEQARKEI